MIVKNSLSVTASNFSLIFKIMIFALFLVLLFAAVFMGILSPIMQELGEALDIQTPVPGGNPPLEDGSIVGSAGSLSEIVSALGSAIADFAKVNAGTLWFALGMFILTVFCGRFILGIILFPAGKYLSNKMTSGYSDGLWRTFLKSARTSVAMSFYSSLIFLFYDVGLSVLMVYLASVLGQSIGIFAVYLLTIALIVLFSIRTALAAMWLPRVTMRGEKPLKALKSALRDTKKTFVRCFTGSLAMWIFLFLTVAATFVFTLGLSFVIIIPLGIVFYIAMSNVQYCHVYGQNYFKDENTVVKVTAEKEAEAE